MEHEFHGVLRGQDFALSFGTCEVASGDCAVIEIALDGIAERSFQLVVEYPAATIRRNFYYSEVLKIEQEEVVIRFSIPSLVFGYAGKVYLQIVGGEPDALRSSAVGDDASIRCRQGNVCGPGDSTGGMLGEIRKACERVDTALAELENKSAEDFGALSIEGGAVAGDLAVGGALTVGSIAVATESELAKRAIAQNTETVSAKDTYSCDYINELHREALDVDPYFESTAGSIVTVDKTPAGKYVEPEDYAVSLPLGQRENLLPYASAINQTKNKIHVESTGNGWYLLRISAGENIDNSSITVPVATQTIKKGRYYFHLRNNNASGSASFGFVGISNMAFMSVDRIFMVDVAQDTTVNQLNFYALPTAASMEIRFQPSLERIGDITDYAPFTGALSPINPIPVESPSTVAVRSTGQNLMSVTDRPIVVNAGYYQDVSPIPPYRMTAGKTYTVAYEYEIENATAPVSCDVGRGTETTFMLNVIAGSPVADSFPAKGRKVVSFLILRSDPRGDYIHLRPLRFAAPNTITNARIFNVMLVEGAYTAETMPDFIPYESETVTLAPRDTSGNAAVLSGGVSGAENKIEYKDGKPYYVKRTSVGILNGTENWVLTSNNASFYMDSPREFYRENSQIIADKLAFGGTVVSSSLPVNSIGCNTTINICIDPSLLGEATVVALKSYLAMNPIVYHYALAVPIYIELDPASLPVLQTYSPQTTFSMTSDITGLNPSIDLTSLSAREATFAKGMLKLNNGEVLTPLTTADMVMTADGRTLSAVLAEIQSLLKN